MSELVKKAMIAIMNTITQNVPPLHSMLQKQIILDMINLGEL